MNRLLCLWLLVASSADACVFTDEQGRQVDAELRGVRGENVVLGVGRINGQWPMAKLSPPDQLYVKDWVKTHTAVKHVMLQVTEKDGAGSKGEIAQNRAPSAPTPLPFAPPAQVKTSYKHYEIQVQNPSTVDAAGLRVAYVIYIMRPDGTVGISPGSERVETLAAGKAARISTEGVSAEKTKSTRFKIGLTNRAVSVSERNVRSYEQFGGVWVKVSGPDGTQVGEYKKLSPELEKAGPPWQEEEVKEEIPVLQNLGDLLELIKKLGPPGLPLPPR